MLEFLYSIIVVLHAYRFPLVACLLILAALLAIIPFKRNVRKFFLKFSFGVLVVLVLMVLMVEFRSPFSKPSVEEQQVEILIQSLEKDSEQVIRTIKESGTRSEYSMHESYYLDHNDWQTIIVTIYNKAEYFEGYDLLKEDINFDNYDYSDKYDFRKELKSNGYFEQDNGKGVRALCYPVFYRVSSKASIYLPFEPDGSYQERVVMVFDNTVVEIIGESELKCSLDLGKKIQEIIDKLG